MTSLDEGAEGVADRSAAVDRNFHRIVEQNVARLGADGARQLVDGLDDVELANLAQLYTDSSSRHGGQNLLLPVLANRLDGGRLARLSRFFGYAPVYAAITQAAPLKAQQFAASAAIQYDAPVAGRVVLVRPALNGGTASPISAQALAGGLAQGDGMHTLAGGAAPSVENTLYEIYLDFRTAPVGSLGVRAALYETMTFAGSRIAVSFSTGYYLGSKIDPFLEKYFPGFYDTVMVDYLGRYVFNLVAFTNASFQTLGSIEWGGYMNLVVPNVGYPNFQAGGDYGVTSDWASMVNGTDPHCGSSNKCKEPPPSGD